LKGNINDTFLVVGTSDFHASSKFYDKVFVPLGLTKVVINEIYIGYAQK